MMRFSIERLRAVVLAGALLLLATLGGLFWYAHHRARGLLRNLPKRLGAEIQKQTNGVTYSQTMKGRTVFTVHAEKATQLKNGQAELEDAGIVLYGDGDGRADRIYGKSFHYDQSAGVIRAMGVVQLDLAAPAPVSAEDRLRFASGSVMHSDQKVISKDDAQQPVHVTTSDLVYSQHSGVASTVEPLHFVYKGMVGDARGASYNAQTGFTTFEHDIRLSGVEGGRAFKLTAQHGEYARDANQLVLHGVFLQSLPSGPSAKQLTAAVLLVHLAEGGIDRATGSDGVEIADGGSSARAPLADLTFEAKNRPAQVTMRGGVQFVHKADESGGESLSGMAAEGLAHFDQSGALATLLLSREVALRQSSPKDRNDRTLSGKEVLLEFADVPGARRRWVRQVSANGSAQLQVTQSGAAAKTDLLAADRLQAQLRLDQTGNALLDTISGRGHVLLHQSAATIEEMSRAETIDGRFGVNGIVGAVGAGQGPQLLFAVEQGGVTLERDTKRPDGTTDHFHGSARTASYDGVAGQSTLEGDAALAQGTNMVRADRVVMTHATGDAEAYGGVQATLTPVDRQSAENRKGREKGREAVRDPSSQMPVHAVAAHAVFQHDDEAVTLTGGAGQVARLWRGASQIEAPLLVLRQQEGTLDASGDGRGGIEKVRAVLTDDQAKASATEGGTKQAAQRIVRVESDRLHYSDPERRAEFLGEAELRTGDGVLRGKRVVATLSPTGDRAAGAGTVGGVAHKVNSGQGAAGLFDGELQRVVADGGVTVEQPGRLATGQQVIYTASDGLFVLTGTLGVPPVVVDEATGSITGAVLRFHAGDNSDVAVEGAAPAGKPGRVHTELRLKQ